MQKLCLLIRSSSFWLAVMLCLFGLSYGHQVKADMYEDNFDTYTTGSLDNQNGWTDLNSNTPDLTITNSNCYNGTGKCIDIPNGTTSSGTYYKLINIGNTGNFSFSLRPGSLDIDYSLGLGTANNNYICYIDFDTAIEGTNVYLRVAGETSVLLGTYTANQYDTWHIEFNSTSCRGRKNSETNSIWKTRTAGDLNYPQIRFNNITTNDGKIDNIITNNVTSDIVINSPTNGDTIDNLDPFNLSITNRQAYINLYGNIYNSTWNTIDTVSWYIGTSTEPFTTDYTFTTTSGTSTISFYLANSEQEFIVPQATITVITSGDLPVLPELENAYPSSSIGDLLRVHFPFNYIVDSFVLFDELSSGTATTTTISLSIPTGPTSTSSLDIFNVETLAQYNFIVTIRQWLGYIFWVAFGLLVIRGTLKFF